LSRRWSNSRGSRDGQASTGRFLPGLPVPGKDELIFCSLGGVGEIGMNAALYGHAGEWIMVDCGITFADDENPGIDVILPDLTPARALGGRLRAVVLTHGHEDHLGAVPYVGASLGVPIYATPFTSVFLKRKLQEDGAGDIVVRTIDSGGEFSVGLFKLRYLPVPHSIPESQSLAIQIGIGNVLHTGDWKTDPHPVVGKAFESKPFEELGRQGVLAMFCDSTNAMVEGRTGSESVLAGPIAAQIANAPRRTVFTCFASNIARMVTICRAAAEQNRHVGLVGRSLKRMRDVAEATGYWPNDLPAIVDEDHLSYLPSERVAILCTGSQGEPQAALARMATGSHPHISLDPGDTVIYSSKDIPGNERAIGRIRNRLVTAGVNIVTDEDANVHVSGHPARDELRQMFGWVKPKLLVPVHGEASHLHANAQLGLECGIPVVAQAPDGTVLRIRDGEISEFGRIKIGRQALDGSRALALGGEALRDRRKVLANGSIVVSVAIDRSGELVADIEVTQHGLTDGEDEAFLEDVAEAVEDTIGEGPGRVLAEQTERVRSAIRRLVRTRFDKRPLVTVHLLRVDG